MDYDEKYDNDINTARRQSHFNLILQHNPTEEEDTTVSVVTITRTTTVTTVTPLVPELMAPYLDAIDIVLQYLNYGNTTIDLHPIKCRAVEWCVAHYGTYRAFNLQPNLSISHPMLLNLDVPSWFRLDKWDSDELPIQFSPRESFDEGRHDTGQVNGCQGGGPEDPLAPPSQRTFTDRSQQTVLDRRCTRPLLLQHALTRPVPVWYNEHLPAVDPFDHYRVPFVAKDIGSSQIIHNLPEVVAALSKMNIESTFFKSPMSRLAQPYRNTWAKLRDCHCSCSKRKRDENSGGP
ncbi:hypothetical protein QQX98_007667 [Neonectria punicea]|uniref:Uncharacterized protein n=1 Tax=Neonectria punicea TaxID=979145 RepID=A0ABR1GX93_9HYPO